MIKRKCFVSDNNNFIFTFDVLSNKTNKSSSTLDRKSTRLNSSHVRISYAVFCLKKKKKLILLPSRTHLDTYDTLNWRSSPLNLIPSSTQHLLHSTPSSPPLTSSSFFTPEYIHTR